MMPDLAILAGGLATRMRPATETIPKSLLPVAGRPFLDHQLALLKRQGISRVVLCAGHLGGQIRDFAGDGSAWGLKVEYSFDGPVLLGTGGALRRALPLLSDPFWVLYGDSYLEMDLGAALSAWQASGLEALMTVYQNEGKYDTSNVIFRDGKVLRYDKTARDPAMLHIDHGLGLLRHSSFGRVGDGSFDLAGLYGQLARAGQLAGFEASRRFFEIGSAEGLAETERHLLSQGGTASKEEDR